MLVDTPGGDSRGISMPTTEGHRMRAWAIVSICFAVLGLGALVYAAAPGLSSPVSGMSGGAFAFRCAHTVYSSGPDDLPPADLDREIEYSPGEAFNVTFPAGRYHAQLEYHGADVVFLGSMPPGMRHLDPPCPEKPYVAHLRGLGDGKARFRVWIPTDEPPG